MFGCQVGQQMFGCQEGQQMFGCQEGQQMFVPSGHFLILERAKNHRGLSKVNKVDGTFWNGVFRRTINASCAGTLSCWRIHLSGQSLGLFLRTDFRNLVSTSK